jgi:hypothetical protein
MYQGWETSCPKYKPFEGPEKKIKKEIILPFKMR